MAASGCLQTSWWPNRALVHVVCLYGEPYAPWIGVFVRRLSGYRQRIKTIRPALRRGPVWRRAVTTQRRWLKSYPEDINWELEHTAEAVPTLLDAAVAEFPDNPAIDFFGDKMLYRELGQKVAQFAQDPTKNPPRGVQ